MNTFFPLRASAFSCDAYSKKQTESHKAAICFIKGESGCSFIHFKTNANKNAHIRLEKATALLFRHALKSL